MAAKYISMTNVYEGKFENAPSDNQPEQKNPNKAHLEYKLDQVASAFHDRPEVLGRVSAMRAALERLEPERVTPDSHFAHILGQLNTELGFVPRLARHKAKEDWEKARRCEKIVDQTEDSVITYIDLCLSDGKGFLLGELSSPEGYWKEKGINDKVKKIQELNANEFVQLSAELLEGELTKEEHLEEKEELRKAA